MTRVFRSWGIWLEYFTRQWIKGSEFPYTRRERLRFALRMAQSARTIELGEPYLQPRWWQRKTPPERG